MKKEYYGNPIKISLNALLITFLLSVTLMILFSPQLSSSLTTVSKILIILFSVVLGVKFLHNVIHYVVLLINHKPFITMEEKWFSISYLFFKIDKINYADILTMKKDIAYNKKYIFINFKNPEKFFKKSNQIGYLWYKFISKLFRTNFIISVWPIKSKYEDIYNSLLKKHVNV